MNEQIKNQVFQVLNHRAPNAVREEFLLRELSSKFPTKDITDTLKQLIIDRKITSETTKNSLVSHTVTTYRLSSYENIGPRTFIKIGGTEIPRLMDADVARAEDTNIMIEALEKYSNSLEDRFKEIMNKEIQSYWANIVTLFGLFIGVFTLIVTFINTSNYKIESWEQQLIFNANLLGQCLILILFVLFVKILFRK